MKITLKTLLEIASHEGLVYEAYKDAVGVWTWGIGVTNSSGHIVYPRYKDNPQSLKRVLEVYEWLVRTRYAPAVVGAFGNIPYEEHHFAAALSFHWNTGAIDRAIWFRQWKEGDSSSAYESIMNWTKQDVVTERREKERDLFFSGRWNGSGYVKEWRVKKPSYKIDWSKGYPTRIDAILADIIAERDDPNNKNMPDSQKDANDIVENMKETMMMVDPSIVEIIVKR